VTTWHDSQVVVMGLGAFGGGVGVARWLCQQGAQVTVTDLRQAHQLADSIEALGAAPCKLVLGRHEVSDFTQADVVVVNPAVPHPWDNPFLAAATEAGVSLTTEIRILIEQLDRRQCIGITGTAGKSTTASMTHHLLKRLGLPTVLGGNIGGSLLSHLDTIGDDTHIVLELSSAQLHWLNAHGDQWPGWSPAIAAITNIADNHLDWHQNAAHYVHSKETIARYQCHGDIHVCSDDVPDSNVELSLPGRHNQRNAGMAIELAHHATGVPRSELATLLGDFQGLPHRLCAVGPHSPPRFFNDSKSTTPEATVLAVASFPNAMAIHLIAGGYDKGVPLESIAKLSATLAGLYTIGDTGPSLADAAGGHAVACGTLERAVQAAIARMGEHDILLLSPGCASWDQFPDFRARGHHFEALVSAT
jgi:UDP-N-acetylmuramoylalanine--D-glutamate ligase